MSDIKYLNSLSSYCLPKYFSISYLTWFVAAFNSLIDVGKQSLNHILTKISHGSPLDAYSSIFASVFTPNF